MGDMRIRIEVNDRPVEDRCTVTVQGQVYCVEARELERRLSEAFLSGSSVLVVDLSNVSFMASDGLGVLVRAHRRLRGEGRSLQIVQPGERVLGVFRKTGLIGVLALVPPEADTPGLALQAECSPRREPAVA